MLCLFIWDNFYWNRLRIFLNVCHQVLSWVKPRQNVSSQQNENFIEHTWTLYISSFSALRYFIWTKIHLYRMWFMLLILLIQITMVKVLCLSDPRFAPNTACEVARVSAGTWGWLETRSHTASRETYYCYNSLWLCHI